MKNALTGGVPLHWRGFSTQCNALSMSCNSQHGLLKKKSDTSAPLAFSPRFVIPSRLSRHA